MRDYLVQSQSRKRCGNIGAVTIEAAIALGTVLFGCLILVDVLFYLFRVGTLNFAAQHAVDIAAVTPDLAEYPPRGSIGTAERMPPTQAQLTVIDTAKRYAQHGLLGFGALYDDPSTPAFDDYPRISFEAGGLVRVTLRSDYRALTPGASLIFGEFPAIAHAIALRDNGYRESVGLDVCQGTAESCGCEANQTGDSRGLCRCCPGFSAAANGACTCPSPKFLVDRGQNRCPTCECPSGTQQLPNGDCAPVPPTPTPNPCSNLASYCYSQNKKPITAQCECGDCVGGGAAVDGACQPCEEPNPPCSSTQYWDKWNCACKNCPSGRVQSSSGDSCVCPDSCSLPKVRPSGTCGCQCPVDGCGGSPGIQDPNDCTCGCPHGYTWDSAEHRCVGDAE